MTVLLAMSLPRPGIAVDAQSAAVTVVPSGVETRNASHPAGEYRKFNPIEIAWNVPGDIWDFGSVAFTKTDVRLMAAIAASTGLLVYYDGPLYDESVRLGDRLGITQVNRNKIFGTFRIPVVGTEASILELPDNLGGTLYFLGNGWFHFSIVGGFLGYGAIAGNKRAIGTAAEMVEVMAANGLVVLALKMSTGRENPNTRETPSGKWRWFRNPPTYLGKVNKYDAFPSGHLATLMGMTTVIAENYPDAWWIRPLGYSLMTILGFQMVNSGVHWYGDYPLGIYMGYNFAKIVRGRSKARDPAASRYVPDFEPLAFSSGMGLGLSWRI